MEREIHGASLAFSKFIKLALQHPEGPTVAKSFDRTFQFDLTDDKPFYMELKGGRLTVNEGDSGLDWKCRDWERVTCVYTSWKVLQDIICGRRLLSQAFFDRELGYAPRNMADRQTEGTSIVVWLSTLFRLAHEQAQRLASEHYLSEIVGGHREM